MRAARRFVLFLMIVALAAAGCQNGPFNTPGQTNLGQKQQASYMAQLQDAKNRSSALDTNNNDLHAQLAQEQRRSQELNDEVAGVKKTTRRSSTRY